MAQITLTSGDGFTFNAYEAIPKGARRGAVVVIQEVFGVNRHIRAVVDGYAAAGYYAIAPALFDRVAPGLELGYDMDGLDQGVEIAFSKLQMPQTLADLQAAIDHATKRGKVGVVGYCWGGLLTWLAACNLDRISAASSYYGGGVPDQAELQPRCPIILHFALEDAYIPMDSVRKFLSRHAELPVYTYPADHGFNCDERDSYDAASATLAKERTLEFFARHLQ